MNYLDLARNAGITIKRIARNSGIDRNRLYKLSSDKLVNGLNSEEKKKLIEAIKYLAYIDLEPLKKHHGKFVNEVSTLENLIECLDKEII